MSLQLWCYVLGMMCAVSGLAVLIQPTALSTGLNALPRNVLAGRLLSAIAWVWAGYAVWSMRLDIIIPFAKFIPLVVLICIPLTWFWLDNLLPCRAIGGLLTLFPYELLHIARSHPSPWRLVLVVFAYVCIIKGMVLLLYPWKMRQAIVWTTQRPLIFRLAGLLNTLLGAGLIVLGATVLR